MIRRGILIIIIALFHTAGTYAAETHYTPEKISTDLIFKLHQKKSIADIEKALADLDESFFDSINSPITQRVFWINVYNGLLLKSLRADTSLISDNKFWKDRRFVVAGQKISLNDIEYLFLNQGVRKSGKEKWLVRKKFQRWMVDERDSNVVYLLYRGIKEGPAIRYVTTQSYSSSVTLGKIAFFTSSIQVDRTTCTVPGYISLYYPIYFSSFGDFTSTIKSESQCNGNLILFSTDYTVDTGHFFPRYLR